MNRHLDGIGREIAESLYGLPASQQFEAIKNLMDSILDRLQRHNELEETERNARGEG